VNDLSKLRMSVSLFSSLQQTMVWSSRPVDLVLTGALIQCNEDANWELRRFRNEHSVVMKGNHLLLTNILVMLMENNSSDQKLHEKKMFYPQELELQPEDHDAPNVVKINVHRIQKEYAEERKAAIATRRMNRSLSVSLDSPAGLFPLTTVDALKKTPKYVLYVNCKDFLEMQSWTTHFKDLIDSALPMPCPLYPLNTKTRTNGIRRTAGTQRTLHPGAKMQTISLEEAAGRMQAVTPSSAAPKPANSDGLTGICESPTKLLVREAVSTPTSQGRPYSGMMPTSASMPLVSTPTQSLASMTKSTTTIFVPQTPTPPVTPPTTTPVTGAPPTLVTPTGTTQPVTAHNTTPVLATPAVTTPVANSSTNIPPPAV